MESERKQSHHIEGECLSNIEMPRVGAIEYGDLLKHIDSEEVEGSESDVSIEPGIDGKTYTCTSYAAPNKSVVHLPVH